MSTSLQSRIVLGYGYLVALVVVGASGAALGFNEFGSKTERILAENFESVRAATEMLVALERQDSAVLGLLLGEDRHDLLTGSEEDFLAAQARAAANITLEGEAEAVLQIAKRFASFLHSRDRLLKETRENPLSAYEEETCPAFEAVKEPIFELIGMNHRAMLQASEHAQRSATRRAIMAGILVLVGILSFGLLSRALRRDLLDRLADLRSVAMAIAGGNRRRRAVPFRDDELGVVAAQLNAVLDIQQETETRMQARLREARQVLRALILERTEPAALFLLTGELVASSLPDEDTALSSLAAPALRPRGGKRDSEDTVELQEEGRRYRFRVIRTPEGNRVGWLATRVDPPGSA
jgi:hypothetical protein